MESQGRNVYHVTTVGGLYCTAYCMNIAEYSGPAAGRLRKHYGPAAGGRDVGVHSWATIQTGQN